MSVETLAKVPGPSAAEVSTRFDLDGQARRLLRDGMTSWEFLDALLHARHGRSAVAFVAHLLPPRDAVWWGCVCLRGEGEPGPSPREEAAYQAAVQWVREPCEANRRLAEAQGEAAGFDTPAGALALAAFWSGGSISLPHLPYVEVKPFVTARAVSGALILAAARRDPRTLEDTLRRFVEIGIRVADGTATWARSWPGR